MRLIFARAITLAVVMIIAAAASSWAANEPVPVWPTYHYDIQHTGHNQNSRDISDPGSIQAVWIFPRITDSATDAETIVDDESPTGFSPNPMWRSVYTASDAWLDHFFHAPAVPSLYDPVTKELVKNWTEVSWSLPDVLPRGSYQIYVWVPGNYTGRTPLPKNAETAHYRVYDDRGVTDIAFDQSDGYGAWKLLTPRFFSFSGQGAYRVVLSNLTDYTEQQLNETPRTVVADAVKFLPATGQEVYTSPASAELYYDAQKEDGINWQGMAPFVYIGTVESPVSTSSEASDLGSVYCINSVTPTTQVEKDWTGTDQTTFQRLSEKLGVPRWRYPDATLDRREELEGPIEGGVYASPTLGYIKDPTKGDRLVCFVAGMDRQIYALDANNGDLVWKGPGVTASEGALADPWVVVDSSDAFGGEFHEVACVKRPAAGDPANPGKQTVTWEFASKLGKTGAPAGFADPKPEGDEKNPLGWSYSVYAWLPVPKAGEAPRVRDAVYTIAYQKFDATLGYITDTVDLMVDQGSVESQGKWVKIGTSYFNVQSVSVTNETGVNTIIRPDGTIVVGPDDKPLIVPPGYYSVAADAVMIVPDTIDAFSYSTPLLQKISQDEILFAASSGGRVLAFNAALYDNSSAVHAPVGSCRWIYPGVRTQMVATVDGGFDVDPLGEIAASPAFQAGTAQVAPDRLFVACFDGQVHALADLGNSNGSPDAKLRVPTEYWVFPNASEVDSGENVAAFTSSPTVDISGNQLFIGSTSGVFYCLDTVSKTSDPKNPESQLKWRYPGNPTEGSDPLMPLGGYRFSTPALATVNNTKRVWCGSSDGRIYSFDASASANERRIWVEFEDDGKYKATHGPEWYYEPQMGSPIQGSVALDNGPSSNPEPTMFVGDMRGTIHWFRARNGTNTGTTSTWKYKGWRTEGELFSSVNITNTQVGATKNVSWLYVGGSDGRVYALSHDNGAWGGEWHGGAWPFGGLPNSDRGEEVPGPDTEIQMDIFPGEFYKTSEQLVPEPPEVDVGGTNKPVEPTWPKDPNIPDGGNPDPWDPCILGRNMKIIPSTLAWTDSGGKSHSVVLGSATNDDIDAYLTYEAKKRRDYAFLASDRAGTPSQPLYFEWGETINIILWNLPYKIRGSNSNELRNSIKFNFSNASAGSNAGSQVPLTGSVRTIKPYTVLKEPALTTGTPRAYEALKYDTGTIVKRYYALAQIEIKPSGSRPPSPGPGWVLTCTVATSDPSGTGTADSTKEFKLARLTGGKHGIKYEPVYVDSDGDTVPDTVREQPVGINNPLAISDDGNRVGGSAVSIGWPLQTSGANAFTTKDERYNPQAHFNGNAVAGTTSTGQQTLGSSVLPTMNLNRYDRGVRIGVAHGTSSREGQFYLIDRGAAGCTITSTNTTPPATDAISRLRVTGTDLRWRGGDTAIANSGGIRFPWDQGSGSVDYPHIFRRSMGFRKVSDDTDPTKDSAKLPAVMLRQKSTGTWDTEYGVNAATCPLMRPDTVFVAVNVPRFQPANGSSTDLPNKNSRYDLTGYSRSTEAYVDSDGNREFAGGNTVRGRPSTYQEAYREFKIWLTVPPDPRIEVEEQLVDIGRPPHGLGEALTFPFEFQPYNANPEIRQWFKTLTIKNAGNVNLPQLKIAKLIQSPSGSVLDVGLLSDQVNPTAPLPGAAIVSSLDGNVMGFNAEPFTTMASTQGALGYTLSKPRVGDPDPTILTIPDKRKWDLNYNYGQTYAIQALRANGWAFDQPLSPMVSIQVPLTQPIGSYQSYNPIFGDASVPVFSDWNGTGRLEPGEPFAAPSFQLKATVREAQLTGGVTATMLPQIDVPSADPKEPMPRVGDATPAAFRDANTGNVYLFWSSNRMFDPSLYPDWTDPTDPRLSDFAGAPWFIDRAMLEWVSSGPTKGWQPFRLRANDPPLQWWQPPSSSPYLPEFQWPSPTTSVMPWTVGGTQTDLLRVKHYSPVLAEDLTVSASADKGRTWLAWVGCADMRDPATNRIERHYMLFYTDATGGDVANPDRHIYSVQSDARIAQHDSTMEKRSPSLAVWRDALSPQMMWLFWQGGDKGNWSIFYSSNLDENQVHDPAVRAWTPDSKLRTPDSLASVGAPNAVRRELWVDETQDEPDSTNARSLLDVVYSGVSKRRQNSDILLSRYIAITEAHITQWNANHPDPKDRIGSNVLPSRAAQRMPRSFNEKLERDPRFGFWTGKHLAWVRLDSGLVARGQQVAVLDDWGGYNASAANVDPDLPYIRVILPRGYKRLDGTDLPAGTVVSATDGSIQSPDDTGVLSVVVPGQALTPTTRDKYGIFVDEATGIYTYKYPQADTAAILGDMVVDYSEGIIRFTKLLPEKVDTTGSEPEVLAPEVRADYTPQTWRLTTDLAGDSSPRAFIERTEMTKLANPGLCDWKDTSGHAKPTPVDRLWVFWRKAGTGIESGTIYYRTMRVGIDLTQQFLADGSSAPPVAMKPDGTAISLTVSGNLGPWELDRTGRYIWFTETDERYRSLFTPDSLPALGANPGPITLNYTGGGEKREVVVHDVYWQPELSEQSLFGYAADSNVNEGSIYAFADPDPMYLRSSGTFAPLPTSKIWVFWTSTRGGTSDLFWETLSPNFSAK